ncbi:phosphoglucosamine mutase [Rubellicoccus peritrichatus]|uniref:Phosphoglucosamine mutase n=1 Tax=Rubellicoccus peritrichatus TaxID=3080537 RepID=A0AAQ3LAB9_9BACT|nr:phosphoglucosamine mutase [Puniceicoccus sp. CR14]WOO39823.1 phosphoglucosamine mutase [Puniceicoccus sp. CR14]
MSRRYFGTDGIRGAVGGDLMNVDFLRRVGYALADFLIKHNHAKPVTAVIGRDTRASGEAFEKAICEGLCVAGVHVIRLGVVPTPAVSMSTRDLRADLGIVLTASHNPSSDNGLKLFDNRGLKFASDAEAAIEDFIDKQEVPDDVVHVECAYDHDSSGHYVNFQKSLMHQNCLKDWKIVLDTANGAAFKTSPAVFKHFGADLLQIGAEPDGENINQNVGSECPEQLAELVIAENARLGIAHDGDADRAVFCDEKGFILSGEEVMGAIALDLIERDKLNHNTLVTTVHSNLGLDHALNAVGGKTIRTAVGDRNILHAMLEGEYTFGGESSGHYLFFEQSKSGDGLLAAIRIVELMLRTGKPLSELRKAVRLFPQATKNIHVSEKLPLESCDALSAAIARIEQKFGNSGRVLVRYSGTEPQLRLLVEAEDDSLIAPAINELEGAVRADLPIDK